jgi:hypothetical protein
LQAASAEQQRAAAARAALLALFATDVAGDEVDAARHAVEAGQADAALQQRLKEIAAEFDEQAFPLQDERPDEYLVVFSGARAVSALAFALDPDPQKAALEGVYEASAAFDDPAPLFAAVAAEIV